MYQDYSVAGGPQSGKCPLRQLVRQEVREDDGHTPGHRTGAAAATEPQLSCIKSRPSAAKRGPQGGAEALAAERARRRPTTLPAGEPDAGGTARSSPANAR